MSGSNNIFNPAIYEVSTQSSDTAFATEDELRKIYGDNNNPTYFENPHKLTLQDASEYVAQHYLTSLATVKAQILTLIDALRKAANDLDLRDQVYTLNTYQEKINEPVQLADSAAEHYSSTKKQLEKIVVCLNDPQISYTKRRDNLYNLLIKMQVCGNGIANDIQECHQAFMNPSGFTAAFQAMVTKSFQQFILAKPEWLNIPMSGEGSETHSQAAYIVRCCGPDFMPFITTKDGYAYQNYHKIPERVANKVKTQFADKLSLPYVLDQMADALLARVHEAFEVSYLTEDFNEDNLRQVIATFLGAPVEDFSYIMPCYFIGKPPGNAKLDPSLKVQLQDAIHRHIVKHQQIQLHHYHKAFTWEGKYTPQSSKVYEFVLQKDNAGNFLVSYQGQDGEAPVQSTTLSDLLRTHKKMVLDAIQNMDSELKSEVTKHLLGSHIASVPVYQQLSKEIQTKTTSHILQHVPIPMVSQAIMDIEPGDYQDIDDYIAQISEDHAWLKDETDLLVGYYLDDYFYYDTIADLVKQLPQNNRYTPAQKRLVVALSRTHELEEKIDTETYLALADHIGHLRSEPGINVWLYLQKNLFKCETLAEFAHNCRQLYDCDPAEYEARYKALASHENLTKTTYIQTIPLADRLAVIFPESRNSQKLDDFELKTLLILLDEHIKSGDTQPLLEYIKDKPIWGERLSDTLANQPALSDEATLILTSIFDAKGSLKSLAKYNYPVLYQAYLQDHVGTDDWKSFIKDHPDFVMRYPIMIENLTGEAKEAALEAYIAILKKSDELPETILGEFLGHVEKTLQALTADLSTDDLFTKVRNVFLQDGNRHTNLQKHFGFWRFIASIPGLLPNIINATEAETRFNELISKPSAQSAAIFYAPEYQEHIKEANPGALGKVLLSKWATSDNCWQIKAWMQEESGFEVLRQALKAHWTEDNVSLDKAKNTIALVSQLEPIERAQSLLRDIGIIKLLNESKKARILTIRRELVEACRDNAQYFQLITHSVVKTENMPGKLEYFAGIDVIRIIEENPAEWVYKHLFDAKNAIRDFFTNRGKFKLEQVIPAINKLVPLLTDTDKESLYTAFSEMTPNDQMACLQGDGELAKYLYGIVTEEPPTVDEGNHQGLLHLARLLKVQPTHSKTRGYLITHIDVLARLFWAENRDPWLHPLHEAISIALQHNPDIADQFYEIFSNKKINYLSTEQWQCIHVVKPEHKVDFYRQSKIKLRLKSLPYNDMQSESPILRKTKYSRHLQALAIAADYRPKKCKSILKQANVQVKNRGKRNNSVLFEVDNETLDAFLPCGSQKEATDTAKLLDRLAPFKGIWNKKHRGQYKALLKHFVTKPLFPFAYLKYLSKEYGWFGQLANNNIKVTNSPIFQMAQIVIKAVAKKPEESMSEFVERISPYQKLAPVSIKRTKHSQHFLFGYPNFFHVVRLLHEMGVDESDLAFNKIARQGHVDYTKLTANVIQRWCERGCDQGKTAQTQQLMRLLYDPIYELNVDYSYPRRVIRLMSALSGQWIDYSGEFKRAGPSKILRHLARPILRDPVLQSHTTSEITSSLKAMQRTSPYVVGAASYAAQKQLLGAILNHPEHQKQAKWFGQICKVVLDSTIAWLNSDQPSKTQRSKGVSRLFRLYHFMMSRPNISEEQREALSRKLRRFVNTQEGRYAIGGTWKWRYNRIKNLENFLPQEDDKKTYRAKARHTFLTRRIVELTASTCKAIWHCISIHQYRSEVKRSQNRRSQTATTFFAMTKDPRILSSSATHNRNNEGHDGRQLDDQASTC